MTQHEILIRDARRMKAKLLVQILNEKDSLRVLDLQCSVQAVNGLIETLVDTRHCG